MPHASRLFSDIRVVEKIESIEYFLLGTNPIDIGTNFHTIIQEIEHGFTEEEYGWFKEHNKLGLNRFARHLGPSMTRLNRMLGRSDIVSVEDYPNSHSNSMMLFEEKLDFSRCLDEKLYGLLERMYDEYSCGTFND